ncbi:MRG-domain-containing protein [Neocallimastix lanati (nom. inval.)]|jgi:mortality factor 4-like protein 1|nr:MRG-domain-containing protein [Neocallimastix sp. JGI-2020a]
MTSQTRRQSEKEKNKKSDKKKDYSQSEKEGTGKRQKLNSTTSNAESSSSTIKNNDLDSDKVVLDHPLTFSEDEKVLCFHGPLIYEAKILKGELWENKQIEKDNGPHYYVHYKGWKQTWDEWVPESRVLKYNDVNLKRQSELKAYVQAQKNSRNHEKKIADTGTDRGRKRLREVEKEEEFLKKPEIKIVMPDLLKLQLIDDWENITKDQKLVTLPRKPNVADILEDYKKIKVNSDNNNASNDVILEMLNGIKQYFDKALGNILLYHFERQQYVQATKDYPNREMSSIYGAEHLLRLFVQFPQLLTHTNMDQDSMTLLRDQFTDFLEYMANNKKKIFQIEYENASPIYISLVKDS